MAQKACVGTCPATGEDWFPLLEIPLLLGAHAGSFSRVLSPQSFMRPFFLFVGVGMALTMSLHAELTDEEKKAAFLKSHLPDSGEEHDSSVKHTTHPRIHSKKHPVSHSSETAHHGPEKKIHHLQTSSSTEGSKKKSPRAHHAAPSESAATTHHEEPPVPPPSLTDSTTTGGIPPAPQPSPSSLAHDSLPHGATPSAPITIEKSGVVTDQGMEPAPASPGLFGWLFGGGSHRSYNYLRASTRSAIDHAPVRRGRWKYIIVHNSGTREGNARVFDIYHLRVRHMKNGLAYHFVIGDGHGSGDGQIEIGHRWTAQLNGGHVASDYLNDISLGICLVGDFNRDLPTKAQIGALEELIEYLRNRVGKIQGRQAIIYAHKEINPRPTDCPGDRFPYSWLHGKFH